MSSLNNTATRATPVAVLDHAYTTVTREADPNDEWDRDSTDTSHHIYGIQKAQKYGDLECSFELLPNKTYYLLYYLYDTVTVLDLTLAILNLLDCIRIKNWLKNPVTH